MGTMKPMPLAVACALAAMAVAPVQAQVQEIVLHDFTVGEGYGATAPVALAPDGIYGTTEGGGTANWGTIYKLDTAFHYTVLHNFTNAEGEPEAGVIRDSAGNLYGTTGFGGPLSAGAVYKLDSAGNYTVLYAFTGGADGGPPVGGVIRDPAGNLYGTAGNTSGNGVVYKLDSAGNYTVLYSFTGGTEGWGPRAGVSRDSAGNLYGTTSDGTSGSGVVYKLDVDGNYTVLHRLRYGSFPNSVILAPDSLYGTTQYRGTANWGTVYKLDASAPNYTVLYNFTDGADGGQPNAGMIRDSAGNLYGTTYYGGTANAGVVYKLDSAGNYTVLHTFTGGADGGAPFGGVILGPAGNLIGTTTMGGKYGVGVVFILTGVQ